MPQPFSLQDAISAWLSATQAQPAGPSPDFSTRTTPADGLVDVSNPATPKVDWTAMAAQAAMTQTNLANQVPQPPPQQTWGQWGANMAGRIGGGIAGGALGSLAGPVGTFAGTATGAAMGEEWAQHREVAQGVRDNVNPLSIAAAGATAPIPGMTIGEGPLLRQIPRAFAASLPGSAASSAAMQLAETGAINPRQLGMETLAGGALGTTIGVGVPAVTRAVPVAARSLMANERGAVGPLSPKVLPQPPDAPVGGVAQVAQAETPAPTGEWSRIAGEDLGPSARGLMDPAPVPEDMTPRWFTSEAGKAENQARAFRFLDRHDVSDDLKQIQKDVFVRGEDAAHEAQRRMGKTWAQMDADASRYVPEINLPAGSLVSPEEMTALRRATFGLMDRAATVSEDVRTLKNVGQALAAQSPDALKVQADILAKHGVSTPQALLLAEKKALEEAITAQRSLMGVRSELGRGLNYLKSFQSARAMDDADFIEAALKGGATNDDIVNQLRDMKTPDARYKFIRGLSKPGAQDYWRWYAMTAYLSGPVTQWRNIAGNASNFGVESALVHPVAAGIDRLRNPSNRTIVLGENQAAAAGVTSGFVDGVAKALYYFKNGFTPDDAGALVEAPPEVFGGKLLPNIVGRSMGAADQFFRTVGLHMELHRQAFLEGTKQGLSGDALKAFVSQQIADPTITPAIHKRAQRYASELTFQERNTDDVAGALVGGASAATKAVDRGFKKMADFAWDAGLHRLNTKYAKVGSAAYGVLAFPPSVVIAPFINTPFNILKRATQYSGAGAVMALKGGDRQAMMTAARGAVGMASIGAVYGLFQQGLITGAAPKDPAARDAFYASKRPYSVKVGSRWVPYQTLGPLGIVLGSASNYFQAAQDNPKDALGKSGQVMASIGKTSIDASFLRSMYNLVDAVANAEEKGDTFAARTTMGLLPAAGALRFARDQVDPTLRDPEGWRDQLKASLPGASLSVKPRLDFAGQGIQRQPAIVPSESKADPVRDELLRLKKSAGEGYLRDPSTAAEALGRKVNARLAKRQLPAREFPAELLTAYATAYGTVSYQVMETLVNSDPYRQASDASKAKMLDRAKSRITEKMDAAFLPRYLDQ